MIAARKCQNARTYFYELCDNDSSVPGAVLSHVHQCRACSRSVQDLKQSLNNELSQSEKTLISLRAQNLELHFSCIDLPVSCSVAKPFLPGLHDQVFDLRVSSPITEHIKYCPQCASDHDAIKSFNLSHEQLCRLGQLLAYDISSDNQSCQRMYCNLEALVSCKYDEVDETFLRHLSFCSKCTTRLLQIRQAAFESSKFDSYGVKCSDISDSYLFDYVLPYGLKAKRCIEVMRFLPHVASCPRCLSRMKCIQDSVIGIKERADSGIVTVVSFSNSDSITDNIQRTDTKIYKVNGGELVPITNTSRLQAPRLKIANHLARLTKPIAAAAVIALTISLLFIWSGSQAIATELKNMYYSILRVDNIRIVQTDADNPASAQTIIVSRPMRIKINQHRNIATLVDLNAAVMESGRSGKIASSSLSEQTKKLLQTEMAGTLGLLPFSSLSNVPQGAKWKRVGFDEATASEICTLSWEIKKPGKLTTYKEWEFTVRNGLPEKIRCFAKKTSDSNLIFEAELRIDYPSKNEFTKLLNSFESFKD